MVKATRCLTPPQKRDPAVGVPDIEWTAEDIATLKKAVASGVLSVTYAGPPSRSITYQSLDAMRNLLASMAGSQPDVIKYRRAAFSKGFR